MAEVYRSWEWRKIATLIARLIMLWLVAAGIVLLLLLEIVSGQSLPMQISAAEIKAIENFVVVTYALVVLVAFMSGYLRWGGRR